MALVVASNMAALNTYNTLKKNDKKMANNLEKVSSGMKINSAKDDASGYAISEKMRVRIRALEQDDQNVKNGKSLLFVAHGGIQEIVNNLRTIKEMALNAANDTNTDEDRAIIQKELEQRKLQIDDIASSTEFNGRYLLNGSLKSNDNVFKIGALEVNYSNYNIPTVDMGKITPSVSPSNPNNYSYTITEDGIYGLDFSPSASSKNMIDVTIYVDADNVTLKDWYIGNYVNAKIVCLRDNTNIFLDNSRLSNYRDESIITFGAGCNNTLTTNLSTWGTYITRVNLEETGENNTPVIDIGGGLTLLECGRYAADTPGLMIHDAVNYGNPPKVVNSPVIGTKANIYSEANLIIGYNDYFGGNLIGHSLSIISNYRKNYCNVCAIGSGINGSMGNIIHKGGEVHWQNGDSDNNDSALEIYGAGRGGRIGDVFYDHLDIEKRGNFYITRSYPAYFPDESITEDQYGNGLIIHTGTKAGQNLHINIEDMHCEALGIGKIKVVNRDEATNSLKYIDRAIEIALGEITDVGAYISRLDFTDDNIITAQENTISAESVIRDADMAKEMTDYSKHNVLLQAAQSMLAQANQNSSNVLSLLQ